MWIDIVILILSSVLLIKATGIFIAQTKQIAYQYRLSKLFVALILVALGTSLPELTVSGLAVQRGDMGLSLGGIVGSNITNATLIMGVAIVMGPLRIGTYKSQQNAWLLLCVTFLFISLYALPIPSLASGILLIGTSLGSMFWQYLKATRGISSVDAHTIRNLYIESQPLWKITFKTAAGLVLLLGSAAILVEMLERLSISLGISTTALGLTIAALSTSLPELVTTVIAQRQGEGKIALGNILGSNIYNLAFIGGIISLHLPKNPQLQMSIPELVIATILLVFIIVYWKGKFVPKPLGLILLGSYVMFLVATFFKT